MYMNILYFNSNEIYHMLKKKSKVENGWNSVISQDFEYWQGTLFKL